MSSWIWSVDGWIALVAVLSACSCALLGNFLILRKLSLMGDAISHAVLPGLAIAFLVSHSRSTWAMFVGAVVVGILTAVLTETISRLGKVEQGAAMGVVFSVFFALGIVLIRRAADHMIDLDPECVLFGGLETVGLEAFSGEVPGVVKRLGLVMVLNSLFVILLYKELRITTFDPALATAQGIPANVIHYALMILVALTTVANFEAVGSILVIAMLIVPPVTAHLLTDRLGRMIVVSLVLAAAAGIGGHWLAAFGVGYAGLPSVNIAAMVTVVAGALLLVAVLFSPQTGLAARAYHRFQLTLQIIREDTLGLLYRWRESQIDKNAPLEYCEVLQAVGDGFWSRMAIRQLVRNGSVAVERGPGGSALHLTDRGSTAAAQLIGSHRLWETYLAKHLNLESRQQHRIAERVEHYTTAQLRQELETDLVHPGYDPQGKPIPSKPPSL